MESQINSDNYNDDELVSPDWLSAEFFEKVLIKHENAPELKVTQVTMTPATGKGDHYASVMFRGMISYTTQMGNLTKSLIVKTMPEQDGHKKQMLIHSNVFKTEIGMYSKVLPKFEEILREIGDGTRLYAHCIYHSYEPRRVIIFEDLVAQGYQTVKDRDTSVDEIKGVYTKLAKWHAVSYKLLKDEPEFLQEFQHGLISMSQYLKDPFVLTGLENFMEMLDRTPELSMYKAFFKTLENTYLDRYIKVLEEYRINRQSNGYYVLSHGDFHQLNMMFKFNKDNNLLEDSMLVDFQISNICPITIDLIYSTYMLMSPEIRRNNCKELINFYFTTFVETLKKIGLKGELPNLVSFWQQISQHKYFELFHLFTMLPMVCGIKSRKFSLPDIMQKDDIRKQLFYLDDYVEEVKYLLPRYEALGYFN